MSKPNLLQKLAITGIAGAISVTGVQDKSLANPFVSQGPFVRALPGPIIPSPTQVPGKEFSDNLDRDEANILDPAQNIAWDGAGGVANAFDYDVPFEVDALAFSDDFLFDSVTTDQSALLFSTDNDPNIYFERRQVLGGSIWAAPGTIDAMNPPNDVDGLEVWGDDGPDSADATRFSLDSDPQIPNFANRVAVYDFDPVTGDIAALYTISDIGTAIGLDNSLWSELDLDAMMTSENSIMFSIDPVGGFDGGEIWVWDGNLANPANFLFHGGHLWNTPFNVMGTYGTASENVNALEAVSTVVPEPSSILGILIVSGLGLGIKYKKKP